MLDESRLCFANVSGKYSIRARRRSDFHVILSRGFGFVTFADPVSVEKVRDRAPHTVDDRTVGKFSSVNNENLNNFTH